MKIEISEEDILNLEHCYEKITKNLMAEPGIDLWPFTIKGIIERYYLAKQFNYGKEGYNESN